MVIGYVSRDAALPDPTPDSIFGWQEPGPHAEFAHHKARHEAWLSCTKLDFLMRQMDINASALDICNMLEDSIADTRRASRSSKLHPSREPEGARSAQERIDLVVLKRRIECNLVIVFIREVCAPRFNNPFVIRSAYADACVQQSIGTLDLPWIEIGSGVVSRVVFLAPRWYAAPTSS